MAKLYRVFEFDRAQLNAEERTVPVCFSSESEVDRGTYGEILDHSADGMDLSRLSNGAAVLLNHDPEKQIGVVDKAERCDGDRKGRAVIRFSRSALGEEILQDVRDGIRKKMSVGYERLRAMDTKTDQTGRKSIRFAWRGFELSVVPVEADTDTGVNRGKDGSRTMANDQCAWLCRAALSACNDALKEIEDCSTASDAAHTSASKICRDSIACLAITCEDVSYWSEATAADCVEVCAECAAMCDQAVIALRTIGACANCGAEANDAIEELEEAAECCRENAGIKPADAAAAAEGQQEAETGIETRAKVDGQHLPNANAQANQPKVVMADPLIPPVVVDPKIVEAERTALRTTTVEGERKRTKGIRAACDRYCELQPQGVSKFRDMAVKALEGDTTSEDFAAQCLAGMEGVRQAQLMVADDVMDGRDPKAYSIVRAIQSVIDTKKSIPEGFEGDVHHKVAERMKGMGAAKGGGADGFWIPFERAIPAGTISRRDLNVTTFGQGGAFVATQIVTPIIELLRNKMVTSRLGVQTMAGLTGNVAIPRQTGAATAYALPETATLTKSNQAIDQILLAPHRVGATQDFSKQLLLQSSVDVENFLRDDLMKVIAIKLDKLVLEGSGAGSEPTGILNTTGIGSIHFGATPTLAKMVAFETALAQANADLGRLAYVTTPGVRGVLKVTPKVGTTFPIFIWSEGEFADGSDDGDVNGYRAAATNQVSNNAVFFGNFSDVILAMWGGMDVVVDPYSRATDGVIRITINTFIDVALRHAASFVASDDAGNQ